LYTAVTRGKQLAVLIGQARALEIAVHNRRAQHRQTLLKNCSLQFAEAAGR